MAKFSKKLAVGALVGALILAAPRARTHADDTPCRFKNQLDELKTAEDNSQLDYLERIKQELEIRKNLLYGAIDCAVSEAKVIDSTLRNLPVGDKDIEAVRTRFLGRMDDTIRYYDNQRARVQYVGIAGSKDLAREVRSWRIDNFVPLSDITVNFILWIKNQNLITIAENRLNQVTQSVNTAKTQGDQEVKNLLSSATADLSQARKINRDAGAVFQNFDPTQNSLPLIKDSLTTLSKIYKNFLDISSILEKPRP